jgi:hypothetical protein
MDNAGKRRAMIKAVNRCHTEAMKLQEQLQAIFAPLVGTKILKVNGQLLAKVEALLPIFPHDRWIYIGHSSSAHTLSWSIKITELLESRDSSVNYGVSVYIGNLSGTSLKDVSFDIPTYRTDWTEQELLEKRAAYKVARNAKDEARSACHPFDVEVDR